MATFSSVPDTAFFSDRKLSSQQGIEPKTVLENLGKLSPSAVSVLGKMGLAGEAVVEAFNLSDKNYKTLMHRLNGVEYAMGLGLDLEPIKRAATARDGRLDVESYFILVLVSHVGGNVAEYLRRSRINGSRVGDALRLGFGGNLNDMHACIIESMQREPKRYLRKMGLKTEG